MSGEVTGAPSGAPTPPRAWRETPSRRGGWSNADQRTLAVMVMSGKPITVEALQVRGIRDAEALIAWAEDNGIIEEVTP